MKIFCHIILVLFISLLQHCTRDAGSPASRTEPPNKLYSRIVSLSPSTTEILFELGLGDRVVGVTRFCQYPPEARTKPQVGGYLDANYEAIASLRPDVVFILPEYETIRSYLDGFGIHSVTVNNKTIPDILQGIELIGKTCRTEERARQLIIDIRRRMDEIQAKVRDHRTPRVLISVMRNIGTGSLEEVYAAGPHTYYSEILALAGAINVLEGESAAYPLLSAEGIIHLNPEYIFDIITGMDLQGFSTEQIQKEWQPVRNQHVVTLAADYTVIPGPRFILLLEDIARIVHPEIDWDRK